MSARSIATAVDIEASPATVWGVLMDFAAYPAWNPFIRSIEGRALAGERLSVAIQPPGQSPMRFRPRVQRVDEAHSFSWLGNLFVPGLFDGLHEFSLESVGAITRLHHRERFSGLLVPLLWNKMQSPTRDGFEAMNRALKARAESLVMNDER